MSFYPKLFLIPILFQLDADTVCLIHIKALKYEYYDHEIITIRFHNAYGQCLC